MIDANLQQISHQLYGQLHACGDASVKVDGVAIDSRQLRPNGLFFALKGERVDGHDYLQQALDAGAAAAVVERQVDVALPQIVVSSPRLALGQLAAWWRQQLPAKVIALTGSNGKTTVKEMLSAIFSQVGDTYATLGNFNNDLGMPLTLLSVGREHRFAILEMGANHFGEIEYLTQIARPDIALINNAGPAHLEGFGDLSGVARAKGEIYSGLSAEGVAIINADDAQSDYWRSICADKNTCTFGLEQSADVTATWCAEDAVLSVESGEQTGDVQLQLLGRHNAANALAATTTALAAGVALDVALDALGKVEPVAGRLQPQQVDDLLTVLDDSYNANPASLLAGVEAAAGHLHSRAQAELWVVLGDLGELGSECQEIHASLGHEIRKRGASRLFTLGQNSALAAKEFEKGAQAFQEFDELMNGIAQARQVSGQTEVTILIKGSRSSRMERVALALLGDQ